MENTIGFDIMKLTKDTISNQPSDLLIKNLVNIPKVHYPGTTHISFSVPLNSTSEFQSHGTTPKSRTVETLIDFLLDVIHATGFSATIRSADMGIEKEYNFPLTPNTPQYWIKRATDFLTLHKSHLKNGDICAVYPEADGEGFMDGFAVTNGGIDYHKDYNELWAGLPVAVRNWSTANGISVVPYTTVNGTSIDNGSDKFLYESSIKAIGAMVIDWYGDGGAPTDEAGYIASYKKSLDRYLAVYNGAYKLFIQEWGDTRPANIVAGNPGLTAAMADQVFFPYMRDGKLIGINFWNLFNTPQEGIVDINGDTVTLNAKGQALSVVFKKWFSTVPTPIPEPEQKIKLGPRVKKGTVWYRDLEINGVVGDKLRSYNK